MSTVGLGRAHLAAEDWTRSMSDWVNGAMEYCWMRVSGDTSVDAGGGGVRLRSAQDEERGLVSGPRPGSSNLRLAFCFLASSSDVKSVRSDSE